MMVPQRLPHSPPRSDSFESAIPLESAYPSLSQDAGDESDESRDWLIQPREPTTAKKQTWWSTSLRRIDEALQTQADTHRKALSTSYQRYCDFRYILTILCLSLVAITTLLNIDLFNLDYPWSTATDSYDVLRYIDPLIGTGPGGHVFAGPTHPFGMSKPVADVSGENMAGFASDDTPITGFSHLHDSGTGGKPSMGTFPIFLHPDCPDPANKTSCPMSKSDRPVNYVHGSVEARVGYFALDLVSGTRVEIAASERAALYRFSFTHRNKTIQPLILADASDLLMSGRQCTVDVDNSTGRFTGQGTFSPSFGRGSYKSYFCADFSGADIDSVGIFDSNSIKPGRTRTGLNYPHDGVYASFKAIVPTERILARVGMSWLSVERACQNAEREIPDWNFTRLVHETEMAWRTKLAPLRVDSTGVDQSHLRNFWSGVYRAFLNPQDYSGENQLWESDEPYYDSWYCIWDTFRGVHPFYMLVDTVSQSRMVRSLIDVYKHLGWLPDCRMSFCKGHTQGGSNADVVIVDSYIKGLDGGVDWSQAYAAIVKDAEEQPPNWDVEGRGGLKSWKTLGYIPYRDSDSGGLRTRSISRTYEYAYNDHVISTMANLTSRPDDYEKYLNRSGNWRNIINADLESLGHKGFPQPRKADGSFVFQNATLCSDLNSFHSCYLDSGGHETYEGSPWLYQFFVPHDMASLIATVGGRESYIGRLHTLHNSGVLYMGNEIAFLTAFLYHYAGRPALSVDQTHRYIPSMFNDSIAGIPGNDDSGAMSTFVVFSMLGMFPNAGQSVYMIIPPYFKQVSIQNPQTGKTATIRNINFDSGYGRRYIQSAKLNGRPYTKNWIGHDFFLGGGLLELVLGEEESIWGTREEDCPPSVSTGHYVGSRALV